MRYVIQGIKDETYIKASLYRCENFYDFRSRLKNYEQMKIDESKNKNFQYHKLEQKSSSSFGLNYENKNNYFNREKIQNDKMKDREQSHQNKRDTTCFSCGKKKKKEIAKYCRDKDKGNKCFNCHLFRTLFFRMSKKGSKTRSI